MQSLSRQFLQGGPDDLSAHTAAMVFVACAHEPEAGSAAFGAGLELAIASEGGVERAPEWVQLFPAGPLIEARDGRKWTLKDPQTLLVAFARNQADIPFDVEHAVELKAPKGEEAPAQGWIKEIQVREDKTIWGRVAWTAEGERKVLAREYRYASPAFDFTKTGEIVRLRSAGLVTRPALTMPALAHEEGRHPTDNQDPPMSTLLQRLVAALGLSATASEDDVVTAATSQVALARESRDPEKFVPAADHKAALDRALAAEGELTTLKDKAAQDAAESAVDAAIAAGKIAPASRDHWVGLCAENPEKTSAVIAAMPAILNPTGKGKDPAAKDLDAHGLNAEQVALCAQLNITPEAFAATLKENA